MVEGGFQLKEDDYHIRSLIELQLAVLTLLPIVFLYSINVPGQS